MHLKHSAYFKIFQDKNGEKTALVGTNDVQLYAAQNFLRSLDQAKANQLWHPLDAHSHIDVAVTIVTVSRNRHMVDKYEPHYLTQVVSQFLLLIQQMKETGKSKLDIDLSVCNVDHDPASYKEANDLRSYVHVFDRFNKTTLSIIHRKEKEKQDYAFCLKKSLELKPKYILLVEDDAVPHPDLFTVLEHTISEHLESPYHRGDITQDSSPKDKTVYVKFYHPERLLGFISIERERLLEWFSFASLSATVVVVLYWHYVYERRCDLRSCYWLWLALFVYALLVSLTVGRSNMLELRRMLPPHFYMYTPAPSCCTPALLFPAGQVGPLTDYLSKVTCKMNYAKDHAIDDYLLEKHLSAFLVQPNLFTHIGLYSALRQAVVDPFVV